MGGGNNVGEGGRNILLYSLLYTYMAADVGFINHFTWADVYPLALTWTILRQEIQYQRQAPIA